MPYYITTEEEEYLILDEKYYQFDRNLNDSIEYEVLLYNQFFDDEDDDDDDFNCHEFSFINFEEVLEEFNHIVDLSIDCYM